MSGFQLNQSINRKDMAVHNASKAAVKVFKGFLDHLGLNPPVH
jgi:hypothetical protein